MMIKIFMLRIERQLTNFGLGPCTIWFATVLVILALQWRPVSRYYFYKLHWSHCFTALLSSRTNTFGQAALGVLLFRRLRLPGRLLLFDPVLSGLCSLFC